jgi:hypothetical protein
MKTLYALLFAVVINSAFAAAPKLDERADRSIRSTLTEAGLEVDQEELIDTGLGLQSITSAPLAVFTLGYYRISNVRIKVKVGDDKGSVVCKASHDNLSNELAIYDCRIKNIAQIPTSYFIDSEGYIRDPQTNNPYTILRIVQQQ